MKTITTTLLGALFLLSLQTKGQTPSITFTVTPFQVCACSTVTITCTTTNTPTSATWYFPGGNPSMFITTTQPLTPPPIKYCTPGFYNISVVVSNSNGSDSVGTSPAVVVDPLPKATVMPRSGGICDTAGGLAFDTVNLIGNGAAPYTYTWAPAAGLSCTSCQFPKASPTVTTVYTLTATSAAGCSSTLTDTITVGYIKATIWGRDTICPGQYDTLTASGGASNKGAFTTYSWSTGITNESILVNPTTTTTYTCTITSGTGGCRSTALFTVVTLCTGIETISNPDEIKIMPNPATTQLSVVVQNELNKSSFLTITDITGREVYSQTVQPEQTRSYINISSLARGMYFITLKNENTISIKKFVKE